MLVIYDFIRSLFDKYGKYSLHHWLFMISGPIFPIRKTQVEITSGKSMKKKKCRISSTIRTFWWL